ncbi:serine hydrolase [Planomicrobium sp. Y74]|uniref:serine hydrolase n=1 Tax=Planomicrobium sp. Y74 TaxID=2478977 RepID=UPI000EF48952|nr:serine hydrolase [Planomicrobium sp. Y74]RLQ86596.1 serine hydrolase [Planomicrobium sp. Y74]
MEADEILGIQVKNALQHSSGKVSLAIETKNGRIDINSHKQMKSASTIKMAVLLEAFRQIDRDLVKPYDIIRLQPEDFTEGSGVLFHLGSVKKLSFEDLLTLMIIVSDNTASNLIMRIIGIGSVNALLNRLGCKETVLGRQFMDIQAALVGIDNFTSAADLVTMLKAVDSGELLSEDSRRRVLHMLKKQQLLANLHGRIDEEDEVSVASKSGSLPGVVNDAGIFEYRGNKVFAAVLVNDSPDNHSGQELIAEIGGYIYDWLKVQESPAKGI